jgi:hypothetical protein
MAVTMSLRVSRGASCRSFGHETNQRWPSRSGTTAGDEEDDPDYDLDGNG